MGKVMSFLRDQTGPSVSVVETGGWLAVGGVMLPVAWAGRWESGVSREPHHGTGAKTAPISIRKSPFPANTELNCTGIRLAVVWSASVALQDADMGPIWHGAGFSDGPFPKRSSG